jgi:putative transposase
LLLFDGVFHTPDEGDTLDTLDPSDADLVRADPVVEESPALAGISSASLQGRIALGSRAGARVWRVRDDPDAPWVLSPAPRHAHLTGFDLHANVAVPAAERARLEHLCRYLPRPAAAQGRLRLLDDGRIVLTVETAWADGTRDLVFEPLARLEELAALTPRPPISLVLYHGLLALKCRLASPRGLVRRPAERGTGGRERVR